MNEQGSSNGGVRSKFQQRLKRMKILRMLKFKNKNVDKDKFITEVVDNIRSTSNDRNYNRKKVGVAEVDNVITKKDTIVTAKSLTIQNVVLDKSIYVENDIKEVKKEETLKSINNIKQQDLSIDLEEKVKYVRDNKPKINRNKSRKFIVENKDKINNIDDNKKYELLNDMGTDIINKLKDSFNDKLDELEVLHSELYLLSKYHDSELELKKVKEIKEKINNLIDRINEIIDQYNLYNKNYYIDNVIGIDDSIIVDDIINYRYLLDSFNDEKKFVKEYKALEEFKSLYNNLKEIKNETEILQRDNEKTIVEYAIRDKKYYDIKLNMIKNLDINKDLEYEIDKQNKYFNELISKITVINSEEYVTRHLKGVGNLISQSLKYMGLMILSPLTGMIPGIAMQTLATKKMIGNAYKKLHLEEEKHIRYDAINYDSELNHHLTDVNYVENLVDDALKDVKRLKEDFMMIYNSNIPGYEDTLKNIEKIENKLLHNQNKVSIIKNNLKKSKKLNEDKMIKVRELNQKN